MLSGSFFELFYHVHRHYLYFAVFAGLRGIVEPVEEILLILVILAPRATYLSPREVSVRSKASLGDGRNTDITFSISRVI